MGNPQVTDLAYFAGIIDGEGSVTMGFTTKPRVQYAPGVTVVNTDASIINKCIAVLDEIGCKYHISIRKDTGRLGTKPIWNIQVHRFDSLDRLFTLIIPFMVGKADKAKLVHRWVKLRLPKVQAGCNKDRSYTEEEVTLANEIRNLNDCTRETTHVVKIQSELPGNPVEPLRAMALAI